MPNSARIYNENRKVVLCVSKRKINISKRFWRKKFKLSMAKKSNLITLPQLYQFERINVKTPTRGNPCECLICCIGRLKLTEKHPLETTKTEKKMSDRRCSKCLSLIGKGLSHQCSTVQSRQNLRSLAANDGKVAEQIASSTITNKEASPYGTIRLSQSKGGQHFL